MRFLKNWIWMLSILAGWVPACLNRSGEGGSEGGKVFLALGICLAAVFLVFFIVVKGRERE